MLATLHGSILSIVAASVGGVIVWLTCLAGQAISLGVLAVALSARRRWSCCKARYLVGVAATGQAVRRSIAEQAEVLRERTPGMLARYSLDRTTVEPPASKLVPLHDDRLIFRSSCRRRGEAPIKLLSSEYAYSKANARRIAPSVASPRQSNG